jgi:hypothetical protein
LNSPPTTDIIASPTDRGQNDDLGRLAVRAALCSEIRVIWRRYFNYTNDLQD